MLRTIDGSSIDSVVTDPPAGISFMGKEWDDDKGGRDHWIAWMSEVMRECNRVLKPGGHAFIWALPRTSHWTAMAVENAGFEIRDVVTHLFGSGFPKSLDISKAIDKAAGIVRPRIPGGQGGINTVLGARKPGEAISGEAKLWSGWGTALKPASEHWILARKPISEKTVAANVLKHGCGGLNIDASRVGIESITIRGGGGGGGSGWGKKHEINAERTGRFPANLVFSHSSNCTEDACDMFDCPVKMLDEQSNESNGASRFFYVAKPSKRERNEGCGNLPPKNSAIGNASGRGFSESDPYAQRLNSNHHPTVKPIKLMRYLIRMITPPNGLVLDPFVGSGTTGVAAAKEGFSFIGIERDAEYLTIAEARIAHYS